MLAISTGLRGGELLGLRWKDVNLERGTLRVGRALVRERGHYTLGETKTRRGMRQINLTPRTVNALRVHRKMQLEEKMRRADLYKDHGLIFASGVGTLVHPENMVKRSFKPLLEKSRTARDPLPRPETHLRHVAAWPWGPSETRPRAPWARDHSDDLGHLFALPALDG
jgi:integrase